MGKVQKAQPATVKTEAKTSRRLVMNQREFAEYLGVSEEVAARAIHEGQVPVLKLGGRYVVPKAALDKVLAGEPLEAA